MNASCVFLYTPEQIIFVLIDLLLQHCNINTFLIMEHIFEMKILFLKWNTFFELEHIFAMKHIFELEHIFAMEHIIEMEHIFRLEYGCKTSVH